MFSPDKWFGVSEFYNGVATQSLRFDDGSVHKLTKDFTGSSPDNNKKMTISVWAKRGNLTTGTQMVILSTYTAVRFVGELAWDSNSDSISFVWTWGNRLWKKHQVYLQNHLSLLKFEL